MAKFMLRFERFLQDGFNRFVKQFLGEEQLVYRSRAGSLVEIFSESEAILAAVVTTFIEKAAINGFVACIDALGLHTPKSGMIILHPAFAEDVVHMCLELMNTEAVAFIILSAWFELPLKTETQSSLFSDVTPYRKQFFAQAIEKLAQKAKQRQVGLLFANVKTTERNLLSHILNLYCSEQKETNS